MSNESNNNMPKGIDWLIETIESEVVKTIARLDSDKLFPKERNAEINLLTTLIRSLRGLYYQKGTKNDSGLTWEEELAKIPDLTRKVAQS